MKNIFSNKTSTNNAVAKGNGGAKQGSPVGYNQTNAISVKRFGKLILLMTFALMSLFFFNCKKEVKPNDIVSNQALEDLDTNYVIGEPSTNANVELKCDSILKTTAYGILALTKNQNFIDLVVTEVDTMFDNDDDVLMRKMKTSCNTLNINLSSEMTTCLNGNAMSAYTHLINEALTGHHYVNDTIYTQIYTPYKSLVSRHDRPVICINYDGEEEMTGKFMDDYDVIQTVNNVDSNYAKEHNVWVISINERVNNKGGIDSTILHDYSFKRDRVESDYRSVVFSEINITDKKEVWGKGKADISYRSCRINNCSVFSYAYAQTLISVSNKKLDTWLSDFHTGTAGMTTVFSNWNKETQYQSFYLYEADYRKKYYRDFQFYSNCSNTVSTFCSQEPMYGYVWMKKADFSSSDVVKQYNLSGAKVKIHVYE